VRGSPSTRISPRNRPPTGVRPARAFNSDVLPLPVGPINASTSPAFAAPVTLLKISFVVVGVFDDEALRKVSFVEDVEGDARPPRTSTE